MKRFQFPTPEELTALWRERAGLKPDEHGPAMPPMVAWTRTRPGARMPWWCSNSPDHPVNSDGEGDRAQ